MFNNNLHPEPRLRISGKTVFIRGQQALALEPLSTSIALEALRCGISTLLQFGMFFSLGYYREVLLNEAMNKHILEVEMIIQGKGGIAYIWANYVDLSQPYKTSCFVREPSK